MAKSFLLAFIGGSGLYQIEDLKNQKWINIKTPWGSPSDRILSGTVNNNKVLFLPRHRRSHIYNPSEINMRKKIEKQKAFLEMRGFGFSIIENAIKQFWNS